MLLFGNKKDKLQVDLGDLKNEKDHLTSFLRSTLKQAELTPEDNKVLVDSRHLTAEDLQRVVTKFVYRRNLNGTHWVSLEKETVKINRFKHPKKIKENKNPVAPAKITHGW